MYFFLREMSKTWQSLPTTGDVTNATATNGNKTNKIQSNVSQKQQVLLWLFKSQYKFLYLKREYKDTPWLLHYFLQHLLRVFSQLTKNVLPPLQ